MKTSPSPTAIAWAAELIAWSPGAAQPVDGQPADLDREPRQERAIRATLRLSSPAWLAQPRMTSSTRAGIDAGALDDRAQDRGGEVVRPDARERAAVATDGRADRLDDPGFAERAVRVSESSARSVA